MTWASLVRSWVVRVVSLTLVLAISSFAQNKPPISELPKSSNRFAILVGVGKYSDPNITPLPDPQLDVKVLQQVLVDRAGFIADNIIVLSDDSKNIEPSRANVLGELSKMKTYVSKDSLLLLMFAGHGIVKNDKAFVMPKDAHLTEDMQYLSDTSISVDTIRGYVAQAQVQQAIVLLDTCRDDPLSGHGVSANRLSKQFTDAFDFDKLNKEIQASAVIYATDVGYRAWVDPDRQMGFFSEVLTDGLSGAAADASGRVTLNGLIQYLQSNVPKLAERKVSQHQRPIYEVAGYEATNLVLSSAPHDVPLTVVDGGRTITVNAATTPTTSPDRSVPDPNKPPSLHATTYDFATMFANYSGDELALANLGEDAFLKGNYTWTIKYLEQARRVQRSKVWMSEYPYLAAAYLLGNGDESLFRSTLSDMLRDMAIPNTYLNFSAPISFCLERLNAVRRLVPDADRKTVEDVIAKINELYGVGTPIQAKRTDQVCSFYGEAPYGGKAWLKQDSCIIPNVERLDKGYRQGSFICCGGGAQSPTTAANIPAGLELITTGSVYWSVADPVLESDKFSLTTYCGPPATVLDQKGCNVKVTVVAHYQ